MALAGGGSGLKLFGGLLVAACIAALGSAFYVARQPDPQTGTADTPAQKSVAEAVSGAEPKGQAQPDQAAALDTTTPADPAEPSATAQDTTIAEPDASADAAPAFDVVRLEADGAALVAGTGVAGSKVTIFVDDAPQDALPVDGGGKFVGFLSLPPSDGPRVLTLSADIDGKTIRSEDQVILAPAPQTRAERVAALAESEKETALMAQPGADGAAGAKTAGDNPAPADDARRDERSEPETPDGARKAREDPGIGPEAQTDAPLQPDTLPKGSGGPAAPVAPDPAPTVAAPSAPVTVLRATAEGIELLQADSGPQDRITLDIIGYSQAGAVQLAGRSGAGAQVRVYLDNRPVTDLRADPTGRWQVQLDDVVAGVYTLRLDELGQGGDVVSRLETPFQRATAAALDAAGADRSANATPVRAVTVQTGDTLWAISRDRYGEGLLYVRVFEANRDAIRDPDLIYPGQVFAIPD